MPLHRDIFWIGRQWAVTGHGMQTIDQRLKGAFDIEVSRLWDDDLAEHLRAERWFNAEDFAKGIFIARAKYPEPSCKTPLFDSPERKVARIEDRAPIEPPEPEPQSFDMRIENWPAKLVSPWRVLRQ
jgi:hypothetical protein